MNVFRHRRSFPHGESENIEIWIDAQSKQLVGYCISEGEEYFDPATAADRNNPVEDQFSHGTTAGVIIRNIVFDAQLDPSLFSVTPPEGFKLVEPRRRPKITEELMIEWLGSMARANGGVFLELEHGDNFEWNKAITQKPESDLNGAERQHVALRLRHWHAGNRIPVREFMTEFTEPGTFRYLGKGAPLGDDDRIVCFYQLKSTGKFRAVYADLRVTDIEPQKLPLAVE